MDKKVQVGKGQEKAQSAKDSHSNNPRWEKTSMTRVFVFAVLYYSMFHPVISFHIQTFCEFSAVFLDE